jgi:hypothetical protein
MIYSPIKKVDINSECEILSAYENKKMELDYHRQCTKLSWALACAHINAILE